MLRGAIRSQSARTAPILSLLPRLGGENSWAGCGGQGGSTPRCTHSWGLGAPRWGARMQPRWGPGRWGAGNGERGTGSWVPAAPQQGALGLVSAPSGPAIPQLLPAVFPEEEEGG